MLLLSVLIGAQRSSQLLSRHYLESQLLRRDLHFDQRALVWRGLPDLQERVLYGPFDTRVVREQSRGRVPQCGGLKLRRGCAGRVCSACLLAGGMSTRDRHRDWNGRVGMLGRLDRL